MERSGINKLDYLPAIIKETLRLCPVAPPLLVPREAIEDCKLGHAHVPARTRMVVNVWKRHMSTWTPTCRAATSSFCHLDPGGDHVSAPEWPTPPPGPPYSWYDWSTPLGDRVDVLMSSLPELTLGGRA